MWSFFLALLRIIHVAYCCGNQTCVWGNWHPWGQCNSYGSAGQQQRWRSVCCKAELKLTYYQCIDRCNLTISEGLVTKGCANNSGSTTVTYLSGHSQAAAIAGGVIGSLAAVALSGLLFFLLVRRCKKKQEEKKILPEEKEENLETEKPTQLKA